MAAITPSSHMGTCLAGIHPYVIQICIAQYKHATLILSLHLQVTMAEEAPNQLDNLDAALQGEIFYPGHYHPSLTHFMVERCI